MILKKQSIRNFFILLLLTLSFSCASKVVDVKSPCVSIDNANWNNPCGPKKPINDWWLKDFKNNINS